LLSHLFLRQAESSEYTPLPSPDELELFGYTWPLLSQEEAVHAWVVWVFGFLLGGTISTTRYVLWNSCLQDVSSLLVDAYSVYVYIFRSIDTDNQLYSIFATTAALSFTGRVLNIRCGDEAVSLIDAFTSDDISLNPNKRPSIDE
jgi:hypothetical protein